MMKNKRPPSPFALAIAAVNEFNEKNEVGTAVYYRSIKTRTISIAIVEDNKAVVYLKNFIHCILVAELIIKEKEKSC
jgi:hypothetical protein